ncbi:hypothetical protein CDD83_10560 [Cordyceps sp. RAO-2017]|nr:hypothetical protein CDD83_10560 [Cordyceps sp. RAO-2017]
MAFVSAVIEVVAGVPGAVPEALLEVVEVVVGEAPLVEVGVEAPGEVAEEVSSLARKEAPESLLNLTVTLASLSFVAERKTASQRATWF